MLKSHETGELTSIKHDVIKLLNKNPLLTAKPICKLLDLDYKQYHSYIDNIKHNWKNSLKFGRGSKAHVRPSFHNARGWVYVDRLGLLREDALKVGWVLSGNRNRGLLWRDRLGRMEWFETGRVNLFVRAPALKARVFQLFCNGFSMTGLITNMAVLNNVLGSIRLKSAHAVFDVGEKLPYVVIDLFKLSNGVVIKSGDKSHPTAIEVHFAYPDWAEKNERLLGNLMKTLKNNKVNHMAKEVDSHYIS
jgi:hypothetical protein